MAELAARHNVEILSLFNDSSFQNKYRSIWLEIIRDVREIYDGKLTIADSQFPDIYRTDNPVTFADQLDVYGFQGYTPGSGYPSFPTIPGTKDPTVEAMVSNMAQHYDAREHLVVSQGLEAISTETGILNADGANRSPADLGYERDSWALDNQEQVDYYEASMRVLADRSWVTGLFIWSVSPDQPYYTSPELGIIQDFRGLPIDDLIRIWFHSPSSPPEQEG